MWIQILRENDLTLTFPKEPFEAKRTFLAIFSPFVDIWLPWQPSIHSFGIKIIPIQLPHP